MSSGMVDNGGSVVIQAVEKPMLAPTPTPQGHRRPRVREVSSRFMSSFTLTSSSSSSSTTTSSFCGDLHLPTPPLKFPLSKPFTPMPKEFQPITQQARSRSVQRQRHQDSEADENRPETNVRRSDSSIATMTKPRTAVRLFKERGESREDRQRIDTPVPSVYRRVNSSTTVEDIGVARGMQCNGTPFPIRGLNHGVKLNIRSRSPRESPVKRCNVGMKESVNLNGAPGESRGVDASHERGLLLSTSEKLNNLLVQMSATPDGRSWKSTNADSTKLSAPSCARSLDFPFTSQEQSLFLSVKPNQKTASLSFKSSLEFGKSGPACLPPVPSALKLGPDSKGKKGSGHQEEVHQLRLLQNRYLQWRYANARAEASMIVRKRESEKLLYSLGLRMSELRDSVKMKRIEVEFLFRMKTLFAVLEAQLPYLNEWTGVEGDHMSSLLGTIEALSNVLSQLPIDGNFKLDVQEVAEVLNSATQTIELTFQQVQSFMSQGQQVDLWISELARVFGGEKALVEECGELLQHTEKSQVEECSLRGLLMQLHQVSLVHAEDGRQS